MQENEKKKWLYRVTKRKNNNGRFPFSKTFRCCPMKKCFPLKASDLKISLFHVRNFYANQNNTINLRRMERNFPRLISSGTFEQLPRYTHNSEILFLKISVPLYSSSEILKKWKSPNVPLLFTSFHALILFISFVYILYLSVFVRLFEEQLLCYSCNRCS